jgi:hypothetical protein
MRKSTSRWLYLGGIVIAIIATILLVVSLQGSSTSTSASGTTTVTSIGNPGLLSVSVILYVISGIIAAVGWIGALVKTARLGRWGWFICLLLLSGITMLVYIFAGPTTPVSSAQPQVAYQQELPRL